MSSEEFLLNFISQNDFEDYVKETLNTYLKTFSSMDLKKFNENLIDPIKMVFDKNILNRDYSEIIELEIIRQRDKTNSNLIGYFHQNIFQYFKDCIVPSEYWDVIFTDTQNNKTYYVELKNKHNTMNSSSSAKTYMKFQNHLLNSQDRDQSICALVEIIAKHSMDIPWQITLDKQKQAINENLRRISIDKFYAMVTGDPLAFKKLCLQLPLTLEKLVKNQNILVTQDSVLDELLSLNEDILKSLYKLAFKTYDGFDNL